jgi:radical SAM protein with 4Fe4S-binding SPASM domain
VFTKCAQNLSEMEAWYDQWMRAVGSAVIAGPSDFAGLIPDAAVADMSPPKRSACARLASRMTVLCDGRVVSCEQDVLGRQAVGEIGKQSVRDIWSRAVGSLRTDHQQGNWAKHSLCATCREWHRP